MTLTEMQRSTEAARKGKRVAKVLLVSAERDEIVRRAIRAIDFVIGLAGATIALTPQVRSALDASLLEVAIAVPPIVLVISSLYFIFAEPSHPDLKKANAVDLLFHVSQVEAALAAVEPSHPDPKRAHAVDLLSHVSQVEAALAAADTSQERLRLSTESVEEGIRQAIPRWPGLLNEFL